MPRVSLKFYEHRLYCIADDRGVAILIQLPFGPDSQYLRRYVAVVPSDVQECNTLRLLFPQELNEPYILVW